MKDLRERVGIRFSTVARKWRRNMDQQLANAGIKDISWSPLLHLDEFGDGVTQKELAESVGMDGSTLVRLLDTLEKKTYITRQPDEHDRRSKRLYLTDQGRKAVCKLRQHLHQIEYELLDELSDEQISTFLTLLNTLEHKFRNEEH